MKVAAPLSLLLIAFAALVSAPALADTPPPSLALQSCAAAAAGKLEPGFASTGIDIKSIDGRKAMPACVGALKENPNDQASRFRLGRTEIALNNVAGGLVDITIAAKAGYVPAMADLAALYSDGNFLPPDFATAVDWARRGAAAGNVDAALALAQFYMAGTGVPRDIGRAVASLKPLADKGAARANNTLGRIYACDCNTNKSLATAAAYFRKAADAGLMEAHTNLADILARKGTPLYDPLGALAHYRAAATAGDVPALIALGNAFADSNSFAGENGDLARQYFQQAADLGYAEGATGLGRLAYYGTGQPKDLTRAAAYFSQAAAVGDPEAEDFLGGMLIEGLGLPANPAQGITLLEASARSGWTQASLDLGQAYWQPRGAGMQPDFAKAIAYYALAADAGSTEAMDALGSIYNYGGFRFAPDIAKAVAWFGAAAARNDPHGLAMTGYFYRMGTGVPRNLHLARVDLLAGAKGGDIGADEELAEMYEAGDGVPADLKTAITWYTAAADGGNPVAWFRLGKLYVDGRAGCCAQGNSAPQESRRLFDG
jgi:hypothetical protein